MNARINEAKQTIVTENGTFKIDLDTVQSMATARARYNFQEDGQKIRDDEWNSRHEVDEWESALQTLWELRSDLYSLWLDGCGWESYIESGYGIVEDQTKFETR